MRAGSRLLKASTQAAVAAAIRSLSAESVVVSAGTEAAVAVTSAVPPPPFFGGSYSIRRPSVRGRVALIIGAAARAPIGCTLTHFGFAVRTKKARELVLKS